MAEHSLVTCKKSSQENVHKKIPKRNFHVLFLSIKVCGFFSAHPFQIAFFKLHFSMVCLQRINNYFIIWFEKYLHSRPEN